MKNHDRVKLVKILFSVMLILVIVLFLMIKNSSLSDEINDFSIDANNRTSIIVYKGAEDTPFYTALSLDESKSYKNIIVEVTLTKDNKLVLNNAEDISQAIQNDSPMYVKDYKYHELTSYDFCLGYESNGTTPYADGSIEYDISKCRILKLSNVLDDYSSMNFYLKFVDEGNRLYDAIDEAYDVIEDSDAFDRVAIYSNDEEVKDYIDDNEYDMTMFATEKSVSKSLMYSKLNMNFLYKNDYSIVMLNLIEDIPMFGETNVKDVEIVNDLQTQGIAVYYGIVNDEEEMIDLLTLGVDGIITQYPSRLRSNMYRYQ